MNKKIYLLPLLLLAFVFTSCEETEEVSKYDNWRARNEAFIDSIAGVYAAQTDATIADENRLYAYNDPTNGQTIYVKKIEELEEGESPFYTSTISVYYRMSYINGETVQETFTGAWPDQFSSPAEIVLNGYNEENKPTSVISGWSYTLPHMKVGERWILYIPYQSGYGTNTGNTGIQSYSTLIYKIQLNGILIP